MGSMVVMKGVWRNDMYDLKGIVVFGSTSTIEKTFLSKIKIWHRRLGHISKKGLVELEKQGLFRSDKIDQLKFCVHYVQGKTCTIYFNIG